MRTTIFQEKERVYETRDYALINPSWLWALMNIPLDEVGKLLINLCTKYGKQVNRNLIVMDGKTEEIFKMMVADQGILDILTQYPCYEVKEIKNYEDLKDE